MFRFVLLAAVVAMASATNDYAWMNGKFATFQIVNASSPEACFQGTQMLVPTFTYGTAFDVNGNSNVNTAGMPEVSCATANGQTAVYSDRVIAWDRSGQWHCLDFYNSGKVNTIPSDPKYVNTGELELFNQNFRSLVQRTMYACRYDSNYQTNSFPSIMAADQRQLKLNAAQVPKLAYRGETWQVWESNWGQSMTDVTMQVFGTSSSPFVMSDLDTVNDWYTMNPSYAYVGTGSARVDWEKEAPFAATCVAKSTPTWAPGMGQTSNAAYDTANCASDTLCPLLVVNSQTPVEAIGCASSLKLLAYSTLDMTTYTPTNTWNFGIGLSNPMFGGGVDNSTGLLNKLYSSMYMPTVTEFNGVEVATPNVDAKKSFMLNTGNLLMVKYENANVDTAQLGFAGTQPATNSLMVASTPMGLMGSTGTVTMPSIGMNRNTGTQMFKVNNGPVGTSSTVDQFVSGSHYWAQLKVMYMYSFRLGCKDIGGFNKDDTTFPWTFSCDFTKSTYVATETYNNGNNKYPTTEMQFNTPTDNFWVTTTITKLSDPVFLGFFSGVTNAGYNTAAPAVAIDGDVVQNSRSNLDYEYVYSSDATDAEKKQAMGYVMIGAGAIMFSVFASVGLCVNGHLSKK